MSAISLDGVEENINSRFVDYSCSTDWEIFINDIYNKSKDLIINIDPETYPIVIDFRKVDFNFSYDINVSNSLFNKWFNLSCNYISLSYLDEWRINSNPSSKRTILSALILGIQLNESTKYLPIFFIPSSKKRIELCYEIIGYQITLFPDSKRRLISHFESTLHDIADNPKGIKDNLMYLDGLYNLFTKKLSMYSSMKYNDKNIDIKIIEYYSYTSEKLRHHYSILRNTESLPITADNLLFQTFEKVNQYLQPALSNDNLNGQNSRKHFQKMHIVNLLRVELTYIGSRDKYIIDNENYTLLNPFDQMSENWTIYSSFDDTETLLLSNILNNFMSNYVISNCIIMKDNMNKNPSLLNLCNHIKSNYCILDITKLYSFTQFLHSDLYQTVTHLTNVITDYTSDKSNDVIDNSKNKQFLQYLFEIKELLNVEAYTNNDINNSLKNIFNLYFTNFITDYSDLFISNPIGWIDLLGLFIGQSKTGLLDLSDIWQEIVVKLRDSYDSDIIYSHIDRYIDSDNPKMIKTIDSLQDIYKFPDTSLCYKNLLSKESNYLPDLASPLIIQKLQLLQYYINMKSKSMQIEYTKIESYESEIEIESKHEDINIINNIQNPMLYHRLPLTSDIINQQEKIITRHTENYFNGNYTVKDDEKIFSKLDSKINEQISPIIDSTDLTNLLFHYQIYLPTLLSDMKAFRLSNPSATLLDFCLWYNISEPIEQRIIDLLIDLWVIIEKSNYQSKPLYRNNTEIEKIFNYFDNITTHNLYSNFMVVCLPTIYLLISTNVYKIIVSIFSNISNSNESPLVNICIELLNNLMNLKLSMNRYISQLNDNLSNVNSNISYDQINIFNIIYEKIKYFEIFYIKYNNLVDIITFYCIKLSAIYNYSNSISDSQPTISYNQIDIQSISLNLTLYNEYTAQNPSETLVLYYLAIGTTKSNNHNISNRLLIPKKKTLLVMKPIEIIIESTSDNTSEYITDKPINQIRIDINEENFRISSKIHEFD